ncbi:MAG: methyltransferase domain-containing protein [Actinomycetota bacterium]
MNACPCGTLASRVILEADSYCPYAQHSEPLDYSLRRCLACGLVRTDPIPEDGEHELFADPDFLTNYADREPLYERFLLPVLAEAQRLRPAPARLVDVGANTGTLVRLALEAGYDATGLELNEAGVSYARGRNLPVEAATLEQAGFEDDSVDVITMSAVAEHLLSPASTFDACRAALKPGGVLVTANSPNIRSLAWMTERHRWYGLQPQGHAWQFTPATLRSSLERHGFRIVAARTFAMERVFGRNRKQLLKRAAHRTGEALGFGDAVTLVAVRT